MQNKKLTIWSDTHFFKHEHHLSHYYTHYNCTVELHAHSFYEVNIICDGTGIHSVNNMNISVKKGNPTTVMAAYNRAFGTYCTQNKKLFDILRNEWNYQGAIISDWGAVHDIAAAIEAGLNLEMPTNKNIVGQLEKGIREGVLTEAQVDQALEKFLEFIINLKNSPKCKEEFSRERQHQDAYEVACEAITLLKNENSLLPITKEKYKKIFVIGGWAEKPRIMGGGSSIVFTEEEMIDSPLEEIKKLNIKVNELENKISKQ